MTDVSKYLKWERTKRGVRITGCLTSYEGPMAIPRAIEGVETREIGDNAFAGCAGLTSVTVPSCVATIGRGAFAGCRKLSVVELPETLVELPDRVFYGCVKLSGIILPHDLVHIGNEAFYKCLDLSKVTTNDRLKNIGTSAFEKCVSLGLFLLPEKVERLGARAFADCASLEKIYLPSNFRDLGMCAFAGCASLSDVKLNHDNPYFYRDSSGLLYTKDRSVLVYYPSGKKEETFELLDDVDEIGAGAFEGATALMRVTLRDSVKRIGERAFAKCDKLETIMMGENVERLGAGAFQDCSALSHIRLPQNLAQIEPNLFSGCSSLTSVAIPDSAEVVGSGAFEDCSSIVKLQLGSRVRRIEEDAFNGCSGIQRLAFPETLEELGASAFEDCAGDDPAYALRKVELPEGVRRVGAWCFSDCSYLEYASIPASVEELGLGVFAFCNALQRIEVDGGNARYMEYEGALYTHDGKRLVAYPAGLPQRRFVIPDFCREIAPYAFAFASNLHEIEIPATVERIGRGAFAGSSLEAIDLPKGVAEVEEDAFWMCGRLERIGLPAGLKTIGARAFRGCVALHEIALPEGLEMIGDDAFCGCRSVESLLLPSTLTSLDGFPFVETTNLTELQCAPLCQGYASRDGVLFSSSGLELVLYPSGKKEPEYEVPPSVATICANAFPTQRFLAKLVLSSGVTTIEENAIDRQIPLVVDADSYAEEWCIENKRKFERR